MATNPAKSKSSTEKTPVPTARGYRHPLQRFHDEMDRLFEGFWGRGTPGELWAWDPFRESGETARFMAPIDLKESDTAYTMQADLPGMSDKDVEIEVSDGVLTLKGEKKTERTEKKDNYHLSERSFGSFQRSIRVPAGVEIDKISADFKNGVLTVSMPKSKEAQKKAKKISIKS